MKHPAWHRLLQYAPTAIFQGRMFSQAVQWRGQNVSVDVRGAQSISALPFIFHLLQTTSYLHALLSCHICFLCFQSFLNHFFCVWAPCNLVKLQLWFSPESEVAALMEGWYPVPHCPMLSLPLSKLPTSGSMAWASSLSYWTIGFFLLHRLYDVHKAKQNKTLISPVFLYSQHLTQKI